MTSMLPWRKTQRIAWHFQQAQKARVANRHSLVLSHWVRALELGATDLDSWGGDDVWMLRASAYLQMKRWDRASADFMRALAQQPEDHLGWFRAAPLLLQADKIKGYQRLRRDMLKRFGSSEDPMIAEHIAKACLLLPGTPEEQDQASRLASRAVRDGTKHPSRPYFEFARGLAEYRQGQIAPAEQRLRSLLAGVDPNAWNLTVPSLLVLAMAQHQQGRSDKAHASLNQAIHLMAQPTFAMNLSNWHDWLICQVLRREADELLRWKDNP